MTIHWRWQLWARQAGQAPTMTLDNHAHVMADLDGADRVSAEATIRAARDAEVSASGGDGIERGDKNLRGARVL